MGIRFYCPNGHKLNVKSFLAGQRGICPKCGSKVDIPFQSTREKGSRDLPIAAEWEERARREGLYPYNHTAAKAEGGAAVGQVNLNAIQTTENTGFEEPAGRGNNLDIFSTPGTGSTIPGFSAINTGVVQTTAPNPFAPAAPELPDPFADAPDAVWYVRPVSGEQFGPVKANIVRQWLTERRIQADTLVWREGWEEWKTADKVFSSLASGGAWNFG